MKLIAFAFILIFGVMKADYETQTNWNGGPHSWYCWTNWNAGYFYTCIGGNWEQYGELSISSDASQLYTVDESYSGSQIVYCSDINGDGYYDIVAASFVDDDISWWENSDTAPGLFWSKHTVDEDFNTVSSVSASDINGDGLTDILGTSKWYHEITWWENVDGSGTNWIEHTIDGDFVGASFVHADDINNDGATDIIGTASLDNEIAWWENMNDSGTVWTKHIVDTDFDGANSAYSVDINGDGFKDILGSAEDDSDITWWENVDGSGTNWIEHTIDGDFGGASFVHADDINNDGAMDVLGSAYYDNEIAWWENLDGSGMNWLKHVVEANYDGAVFVYSGDFNNNGFVDILGCGDYTITWWQNLDGTGTSWTKHELDFIPGDRFAHAADINKDDHLDIVGVHSSGYLTWWDLQVQAMTASLESMGLYLENDPGWGSLDYTADEPTGTSVSFQVRSSDNYVFNSAWSDTLSNLPVNLEGILHDYDSYFQYKVILQRTDTLQNPTLHDVTVSWSPLGLEEHNYNGTELIGRIQNPSSSPIIIHYILDKGCNTQICVYDLAGRPVYNSNRQYAEGVNQITIDDMQPGVYFLLMKTDDITATRRFVVIEN